MIVAYIAGPYRAANAWDQEQNIRRAEAVALEVAGLGAVAVCPHTQSRFFGGTLNSEYWLRATMEMMTRCDAVVLVKGWRKSAGSVAERKRALELGLPVLDGVGVFREWLEIAEEAG